METPPPTYPSPAGCGFLAGMCDDVCGTGTIPARYNGEPELRCLLNSTTSMRMRGRAGGSPFVIAAGFKKTFANLFSKSGLAKDSTSSLALCVCPVAPDALLSAPLDALVTLFHRVQPLS